MRKACRRLCGTVALENLERSERRAIDVDDVAAKRSFFFFFQPKHSLEGSQIDRLEDANRRHVRFGRVAANTKLINVSKKSADCTHLKVLH